MTILYTSNLNASSLYGSFVRLCLILLTNCLLGVILQMAEQGLLKAFIEVTKGVQEQRDSQKIAELEQTIQTLHLRHDQLKKSQSLMKESYENQLRELRGHNIRLDSESRASNMKTCMLERILEEDQGRSSKQDPSQLAAFRIVTEENRHLKALLKKHIGESP